MAQAKAISEESVSVVGLAEAGASPNPEAATVKVGVKEDIEDLKRRIKGIIAKLFVVGLNTPASSIVEDVLKRTGVVDEKWVHYTTVQVSNGVYREAFMKVPRGERIVFIPHCLRDARNCVAPIDEEGYHCAKCGRCVIRKITDECDKRGMKWYMCGGGSQVINIIQNTKPRAIIGIACYNEIQMAMEKLKGGATPVQSVMLKKSGCVNTEADLAEVIEVLDL